jgi:hypothetical protein
VGVKVSCESVGDLADEFVVAAPHISLLGQCLCMQGIFLMLLLGQSSASRGLHPLGMLSKLSVLSEACSGELDCHVNHDHVVLCQGIGGNITHTLKGERLKGTLRGCEPEWQTQEGGQEGRQMSLR